MRLGLRRLRSCFNLQPLNIHPVFTSRVLKKDLSKCQKITNDSGGCSTIAKRKIKLARLTFSITNDSGGCSTIAKRKIKLARLTFSSRKNNSWKIAWHFWDIFTYPFRMVFYTKTIYLSLCSVIIISLKKKRLAWEKLAFQVAEESPTLCLEF